MVRVPRVCIVGFKGDQERSLQQKLYFPVEIIKIEKKQRTTKLPTNCDLYIVWLDFVSHTKSGNVLSTAPVDRLIQHRGGLEKLALKINQFFS